MRLGIMQPYFLPYLGYYSLIKYVDQWIVFDPVQFIRHGWIERNRILKPAEGWQYISVPLQKYTRDTLIKDIRIRSEEDWQGKLLRQIEHYKKAPFFNQVMSVLQECFSINTDSITLLDAHILKSTCAYLNIPFNYQVFSEMDLDIEPVSDAGDWALHISKALKADQYINPPGAMEIFGKEKFSKAGVDLIFLKINPSEYPQRRKVFEPGLSILDAMMFNSPDQINSMIDDFQLIPA
ncbi:MAG: WbqC family protein [Chitinophagaceae bacterium]